MSSQAAAKVAWVLWVERLHNCSVRLGGLITGQGHKGRQPSRLLRGTQQQQQVWEEQR